MTKLQHLKRRLIRLIILMTVGIVLAGVGYYFSDDFFVSKDLELRQAQGDTNVYRSRILQLEQKFNIYETSFHAYQSLSDAMEKERFALNIQKAKKALDRLRRKHRISNLDVKISPQDRYGPPDVTSTVGFEPVFREVTLSFAALSDLHVYAFLEGMQKALTGETHFTKVLITRTRPLSEDILLEVSRGATPTLINASVTFSWIGIAPKKAPTGEATTNVTP